MNFTNEPIAFMTNATDPVPVSSPAFSPAQPAVIITEAALAIGGNLLVITATTRRHTFPSTSRLFVYSMAWSDLLLGFTFPFLVAPAEAREWVYSDTAAQAIAVIVNASSVMTFCALAGMNLDRYYALKNDGVGISRKKAWIFLISSWAGVYAWYIFCTVYGVPIYYDPFMAMPMYDLKAHIWFTAGSCAIGGSALAVAMYCVSRVLKAVCSPPEPPAPAPFFINMNGPGAPPQIPNPVSPNYHSDRSYAKVVLILTLVQTTFPLLAVGVLIASWLGHDLPTALFWSTWLAASNNFLDVVVYSVCQKSFRKAVAEIATSFASGVYNVCCGRNRVDVDPQQNNAMSSL